MTSRIYQGTVAHARGWPTRHAFQYPLYFYGFELAELPELDRRVPLFGHNRIRLTSIHDKDFLYPDERPLTEKVTHCLRDHGIHQEPERVFLITSARFLNYVFNPVSFFFCYDGDDDLLAVIAYVSNTFGESHVYVLHQPLEPRSGYAAHYQATKAFHVSPFFDLEGRYDFDFSHPGDEVDAVIRLSKGDGTVFTARLRGSGRELDTAAMVKTIARYPLTASVTFPRIVWQAAKLHYQRKLPVYHKPVPSSQDTIRVAPPKRLERWAMTGVCAALNRIRHGKLTVVLPDGEGMTFGADAGDLNATMAVRRYEAFRRLAVHGDTGMGEGFMAGDWTSPDPTALLTLLARNAEVLDQRSQWPSRAARTLDFLAHVTRANSLSGSRRNIQHHYDLSNDFFALFLDDSMTYSCGIYRNHDDTLAEAQHNKLQAILDKAEIKPDHHILEIGCGWGSFAIEAAKQTGCKVTGITLSEEQHALATERVRKAGLQDRIDIVMRDYRHVDEHYDRIVSIEMLEAVGHQYLTSFFSTLERALKPEGRVVLQVITIPDQRYEDYRKHSDWIKKHIFPGGHLPSLTALSTAATQGSRLVMDQIENIGEHYAPTLRAWCDRLREHTDEARQLGFDDVFLRKWEYYFCYCEAGFATRMLNNLQIVLRRAGP